VQVKAIKILTSDPGDVSELTRLMDEGIVVAAEVICIIGKTEGNGGRNDFTRDLAMTAFLDLSNRTNPRMPMLAELTELLRRGYEGVDPDAR